MKEKYFPRFAGDEIIVTRKSDRKTITFPRVDCIDVTGKAATFKIAVARAKLGDEQDWR